MPEHMRNGPRKYNKEYNNNSYGDVFEYFDSVRNSDLNTVTDDIAAAVPGSHEAEEFDANEIDPEVLAAVEKELQRIHHRKNYLPSLGL